MCKSTDFNKLVVMLAPSRLLVNESNYGLIFLFFFFFFFSQKNKLHVKVLFL